MVGLEKEKMTKYGREWSPLVSTNSETDTNDVAEHVAVVAAASAAAVVDA